MVDGATPKVTQSASESNSLPMGDDTFRKRADMPSKKSNVAPTSMHIKAILASPVKTKQVAMQPEMRLLHVSALGMFLLMKLLICVVEVW